MRSTRALFVVLTSLVITLIFAELAFAQSHSGKVTSIVDGDTIRVLIESGQEAEVRLAGIDAPEHRQVFGSESTRNLSNLVLNKTVNLDCNAIDQYQRLVCRVLLPSGEDVDLDQVKAGMAWHYKQFQRQQTATDRIAYGAAEDGARRLRVGLWADAHPVQPQDFRHRTQSQMCLDNNDHRIACSDTYEGAVRGNRRSNIYHWPGCPNYDDIAEHNRVEFENAVAAEKAGYRAARNCP